MVNTPENRKFLTHPVKDDFISNLVFKIVTKAGWRYQVPPVEPGTFVWIAHPHTSNWDTILAVVGSILWDRPSFTLVKEEYDKPLLSDIMKVFRMLPIKRSVDGAKSAQEYYEKMNASIVLVPEGTRKKAKGWKKGFHWFAKKNGLRIVLCHFDYENRILGWDGIVTPGDTPEETLVRCKEIYEKTNPRGKFPELASPICYYSDT